MTSTHWTVKSAERVLIKKAILCFHCSKSLMYMPKLKSYVGFMIVENEIERIFHSSCIVDYLSS